MLKILVKKQLLELNRGFFYDQKKGKSRSKAASIVLIILYALLIVGIVGGMFAAFAFAACKPLVSIDAGWLYFAVFGLIAIAMGTFGSVFSTADALYNARDNDLLLSMPIPVRYIIISRLLGTYLMGLLFSAVVIVPAAVVYLITASVTLQAVFGALLITLTVSLAVLVLSCILGWAVAKISAKLKNKSFITVLLSLAFFAVYYYLYFNANVFIQKLIENASAISDKIRASAYPLYLFGRVGEGSPGAAAIVTAAVLMAFALCWLLISKSFLKTAAVGSSRRSDKARRIRESGVKSPRGALLAKEFKRFTQSPLYMLNCGLGILFMPAAAVFVIIKADFLRSLSSELLGDRAGAVGIVIAAALCLIASMNDMTSPSVSLEGKSLWVVQSLPVSPQSVLRAKIEMHLWLTSVPALFFSVCSVIALRPDALSAVVAVVFPQLFILLFACFGLFLNINMPNLSWTNETVPIKQSLPVLLSLFGGWGFAVLFGGLYFLLAGFVNTTVYCAVFAATAVVLCALLLRRIMRKGAETFAHLA